MRLMIFGAMPVGVLAGGAVAELVSVRAAITAAGVLQLLAVVAGAPRLRAHERAIAGATTPGRRPSSSADDELDPA
jgi:hypothetical protein